ncbi:MAG: hypothetical protein JZU55_00750 [Afipia sp.]|nr:hypothetical protein [Afipia sp.]
MLFAEAVRLAAIETLRPTSAVIAGTGFPTMAGSRVFDSRAARGPELDATEAYTPTLSLYTVESSSIPRGSLSDASDRDVVAVIEIVAELSVREGEDDTTPLAESDPQARLALAALTAQARYLLEHAPSGSLFRRFGWSVRRIETKTMVLPELGLRLQSQTTRLVIECSDDDFSVGAGELPEPMRSLLDVLPAQSYARGQLEKLATQFSPQTLPLLEVVTTEAD